jgi:hypothetical protein
MMMSQATSSGSCSRSRASVSIFFPAGAVGEFAIRMSSQERSRPKLVNPTSTSFCLMVAMDLDAGGRRRLNRAEELFGAAPAVDTAASNVRSVRGYAAFADIDRLGHRLNTLCDSSRMCEE